MSKTIYEAKQDLLTVLPFIRFAVEEAQKKGTARLGILSERADGSGKIECRLDCTFVEDLALILDAPSMTDEERMKAKARQFVHVHGLSP